MIDNDANKRPDDYSAKLPAIVRAPSLAEVRSQIGRAVDPKGFLWVVVDDAAKVTPQLGALGLPIELVPAASIAPNHTLQTNINKYQFPLF